jgi:dTDP-4-amino-4,6-dideoxygalactose transaminase
MSKIRLSKSSIGKEEKKAVLDVLDNGFLGMGPEVQKFEQEIKTFIGADREVVCVNSGTAALHLAIMCLGIGPGDEVLVPTITYVASFQAISSTGAVPVACDVIKDTVFIDVEDATKRLSEKTRAIMPVHYGSGSLGITAVYEFANKYNLRVVEDAAHSFGCFRDDKIIGAEGDVVCFSFDGIKNITAGEGGAVVTGDSDLAQKVQDARLLGVKRDTEKRFALKRSWIFDVDSQGFRYHMSDIMAAIGRAQLRRFDELASSRKAIVRMYLKLLGDAEEVRTLPFDYNSIVPHIFPVIFSSTEIRDEVRDALLEKDVEVGLHYQPNHNLTLYRDSEHKFPVADDLYASMLSLPLHPDLSSAEVELISETISEIISV